MINGKKKGLKVNLGKTELMVLKQFQFYVLQKVDGVRGILMAVLMSTEEYYVIDGIGRVVSFVYLGYELDVQWGLEGGTYVRMALAIGSEEKQEGCVAVSCGKVEELKEDLWIDVGIVTLVGEEECYGWACL